MAKDVGTVSALPALVSLVAYISPTNFAAWAAQGPFESERIRVVYASFDSDTEDIVGGFL